MLGRVPVVAGEVSTYGMYDEKTEIVFDDQVVSIENALTVKTEELGSLRYGDSITVDGASYIVRYEPKRFGDGLLCVMSLERFVPETVFEYLVTLDGRKITTLSLLPLVKL